MEKYKFESVIFDNDYTYGFRCIFESEKTKKEIEKEIKGELDKCHEDEYGACVITCALLFHDNGWLTDKIRKDALSHLENDFNVTEHIEKNTTEEIRIKLNSKQPKNKGNVYKRKQQSTFEFEIGDVFVVKVTEELTSIKEIVGKTIAFVVVDEIFTGNLREAVFMIKVVDDDMNLEAIEKEKYFCLFKAEYKTYIVPPFFKISENQIEDGWLNVYRFCIYINGPELENMVTKIGTSDLKKLPKKEFISLNNNPITILNVYTIFDKIGNRYLEDKARINNNKQEDQTNGK